MWYGASLVWAAIGAGVPLNGTVEEPSGRAVEGATIWLVGKSDPSVATSDARGLFQVERQAETATTLWAFKPGYRLAFREFKPTVPGPDEPVRLVLEPSTGVKLRVLRSDGLPSVGTKVRVNQTNLKVARIPAAVVDRLRTRTDAEGRCVLDGLRAEDVVMLGVGAEGMLEQGLPFDQADPTIRLRAVGQVAAWIVGDDLDSLRGWTVQAWSTPKEFDPRGQSTTWVRSTTDRLGQARTWEIAEGSITWRVEPPPGSAYRATFPYETTNRAGGRSEIKIPIRRAVMVIGQAIERAGGAPVPGVKVHLIHLNHSGPVDTIVTDAQGQFTSYILPGKVRFSLDQVPPSYYYRPPSHQNWRDFEIKPDEVRTFLDPIELDRAVTVRGLVVDHQGRPAARVNVNGYWPHTEGSGSVRDRTNDKGEFILGGIPPGSDVRVSANLGLMASSKVQTVEAVADAPPITLQLIRKPSIALSGWVVAPDGRALADAPVKVLVRPVSQAVNQGGEAVFDDTVVIKTGPDGSYQTPNEVPAGLEYQVEVRAPGMEPAETRWATSTDGVMPGLTLRKARRARSVAGRVLDAKGQPVAGVEVFQSGDGPKRTRSATDLDGRFQVLGIAEGPAFLFARKEGFRFVGRRVEGDDHEADLHLIRLDEPAARLGLARDPLTRDEERAIARALLEPVWNRFVDGVDGPNPPPVASMMAAVDPDRLVDLIDNQVIPATDELTFDLALTRFEAGAGEGFQALDAIGRPGGFLDVFDRRPDLPLDVRRSLLDRALTKGEPSSRLLARVADRWLDLGEPARARTLLDRARAVEANPANIARVDLPMAMARVDPLPILKLFEGDPAGFGVDKLPGGIVVRVGPARPADARRLLGLVEGGGRPQSMARRRGCLRMAAVDLAAATTLASGFKDPLLEAVLPAMSARSLVATDPKLARERLNQSFDRLARLAEERGPAQQSTQAPSPLIVMARLLPVAARVDPDHAREAFWRVVAARPPRPIATDPKTVMPWTRQDYADRAELAAILGRFDRSVAEAIFAPVLDRVPGLDDETWGLGSEGNDIIVAAAAFDPRSAAALLDALPEDPVPPSPNDRGMNRNQFLHKTKSNARLTLIRALGRPPAIRMWADDRGINSLDWMDEYFDIP